LTIQDVDSSRAIALAESLCARVGPERAVACVDLPVAVAAADGLVNCTPIGMVAHPGLPLPAALLRPALWVAEIVYFPLETELLRTARALGCRTRDGGGMAVFQAAEAFRLFTRITPDSERMLRHFASMGSEGIC
jgi:shikimate dehydrogenase